MYKWRGILKRMKAQQTRTLRQPRKLYHLDGRPMKRTMEGKRGWETDRDWDRLMKTGSDRNKTRDRERQGQREREDRQRQRGRQKETGVEREGRQTKKERELEQRMHASTWASSSHRSFLPWQTARHKLRSDKNGHFDNQIHRRYCQSKETASRSRHGHHTKPGTSLAKQILWNVTKITVN